MLGWAEERKINLVHIQPGRSMQNGHVATFHGHLLSSDAPWAVEMWKANSASRISTAPITRAEIYSLPN